MKQKILIIDDDQDYCNMVCELLSAEFDCKTVTTGREGLNAITSNYSPIIALVDLNLPDMSGLEVCKELSSRESDREFAIFVISGEDNVNTKIEAFEAGADDYIAKPFELKELYSRIKRTIKFVQGKEVLKREGEDTKNLANIAMAQASQYSYIMNFFKSLNHCEDHTQIVKLFFDAMSFFQLNSSIMISVQQDLFYDSNLSDLSPIEKNIYDLLKDKGRLYEFGTRLMVNGKYASFLVRNFPQEPNKAGEARDFLAALIEGIDSKLEDLELKSGVLFAVAELNLTIDNIKLGVTEHNTIMSTVMVDMLTEVSASYHSLELTEPQEVFFSDLVENGAKRMSGAEELLIEIQSGLEEIKSKMESIQTASISQQENPEAHYDDVELF